MPTAQLIICEKSGRWAVALRSILRGSVRLVETRAAAQCSEALAAAPASFVALEVTEKTLGQALEFVASASQACPAACVIALLGGELHPTELLLREAGAADVFYSPLESAAIVRLAERHVARTPLMNLSLRESIVARLPWEAWATPGFAASITSSQE